MLGMKVISVVNQKGGVGKTTTAVNLSSQLAKKFRVLLIDLDAQGNATSGLGLDKNDLSCSSFDFFEIESNQNSNTYLETNVAQLCLIPSSSKLVNLDINLSGKDHREYLLKNNLKKIDNDFDFIIFDCPPSLGLVTINALTCSNYVLIPVQAEFYALEGLTQLLQTIALVQDSFNPDLDILGVVLTMYDKRTTLARDVKNEVNNFFNDKLLKTVIPRNIRLAEAPSHGLTIEQYDRWSRGAKAYKSLTKEILSVINNQ
jgi:chromosome partitioning protein